MSLTIEQKTIVLDYYHPNVSRYVDGETLVFPEGQPMTDTEMLSVYNDVVLTKTKLKQIDIINGNRAEILNAGFVWVRGTDNIVVQTRESDKINLLGLNATAKSYLESSINVPIKFRDGLNQNYSLSPQEVFDMTNDAGRFVEDIFNISWGLIDSINVVTVTTDLETAISEVTAIVWPV